MHILAVILRVISTQFPLEVAVLVIQLIVHLGFTLLLSHLQFEVYVIILLQRSQLGVLTLKLLCTLMLYIEVLRKNIYLLQKVPNRLHHVLDEAFQLVE